MLSFLKLFITAMISFVVIDYVWLNLIAKDFYFKNMVEVARIQEGKIQVLLWAGLIVYVFLAIGIVHFILPQISGQSYVSIFLNGALFGLVVYGVYDMTNMATLKNWPLQLALVDMAWGAVVTGVVTTLTAYIRNF